MCWSVEWQQMCLVSVSNSTQRGPILSLQLTTYWHCWKLDTDFLSFTNCLIWFHREKQEKTPGRWVRFLMKKDPIDCSCNTTLFSFITLTFHSPWTIVSLWHVYKWTHVCLRPNDVTETWMSNISMHEQSFILQVFLLVARCPLYCTLLSSVSHFFFLS